MNTRNHLVLAGVIAVLAAAVPLFGTYTSGGETFTTVNASEAKASNEDPSSTREGVATVQSTSLLPISSPETPKRATVARSMQNVKRIRVVITAYSSTPDQTDDTPFITASGKQVRDGIVAANMFPLGTKIKIPAIYGDKIFVVEDRMHPKNYGKVDIWFPTRTEAKNFGVKRADIEILEG